MPSNILHAKARTALDPFLRPDTLIAFDFDGVLAPIVAARGRARVRRRTRRLLVALAEQMPCIVVSGRQLSDLAPRLEGIPLRRVYGNFGSEPTPVGVRAPGLVHAWVAALRAALRGHPGIVVEDKHFSVAVHFRRAPNPDRAKAHVIDVLSTLGAGRMLDGTMAVMLVPADAPNKGSTLQRARRELRCTRAVYIGDDGTDEDAFASAGRARLLSIRVGSNRSTRAAYVLPTQRDVDTLLERMVERGGRDR